VKRPEIYVMGNRNPYRISVDQKTGFLWGEGLMPVTIIRSAVAGYDELNQHKGWLFWMAICGRQLCLREVILPTKLLDQGMIRTSH
jgi:hypothetical protein